jgi:hypothetical protein
MQTHDTKGFKVGDTIKIIKMKGEPQYSGKIGTIEYIDDIGQLHGSWGGLAVQADVDTIELV